MVPKFTQVNINTNAPHMVDLLGENTLSKQLTICPTLFCNSSSPTSSAEEFRVKRYNSRSDDRYDTHVDVASPESASRYLALLFYLNDDFHWWGNSILWWSNYQTKERFCSGVPSLLDVPSCWFAVLSGTKYIMSTYLHLRWFQPPNNSYSPDLFIMKITPEKYFHMLRTSTLRRPSDVLRFLSVQDTLLSMAAARQGNPSLFDLNSMKEPPKMSLGRLVRHWSFSLTALRWVTSTSSSTQQRNGVKNEQIYLALRLRLYCNSWWTGWTRSWKLSHGSWQRRSLSRSILTWDTTTWQITTNAMTSITSRKNESPSGLSTSTRLRKVASLIRLSMSLWLVQASGKVYSCAQWLAPSSSKGRTFSILHLRWQKSELLNELTRTSSTSTSKT